jgi:hypothetical protein
MEVPLTSFERNRPARQFAYLWFVITMVVAVACTVGASFGWIAYFEDDGFAPQFAAIRAQNAALQEAIDAENATRTIEDALLTAEFAATQAALSAEIATRTAQDALLLALVNAEIAARTAAQAALNASLNLDIAQREAFDTLAFGELANLTIRITALTAYNVFAQQEFITAYNNLTILEQELATETAARIASENVLAAQDLAQQNFIANFANELAAEIATRTSEGEMQLNEIAAFLGDGILTLNNQGSLNHNFQFIAGNPGFTIGSGGTNIITITNHAILTVNGVAPTPSGFTLGLFGSGNVVVTPGFEEITVGLAQVPIAGNWAIYYGSWMTLAVGNCIIPPGTYFFDAFDIKTAGDIYYGPSFRPPCPIELIDNYNTYNGRGWEVPSSGGVGYGVWVVHIILTLTVQYEGTPFGMAFSMGVCINQYSNCVSEPYNNLLQASLVWQVANGYTSDDFAGWGMNYQDHVFKSTYVLDGRGLPATTGIYPVWYNADGEAAWTIGNNPYLAAISVEYDVSQLA